MEERNHLKKVLAKLDNAIKAIDDRINNQLKDIQQAKNHLQENKRDMAHLEKMPCARQWVKQPCWGRLL